jgi:quinate dehydrogenase (quinone)
MNAVLRIITLILALMGAGLFIAGGWLILLGGSFYYCCVGVIYLFAAVYLNKKKDIGLYLVYLALLITLIWAFYERGTAFWPMMSRIMVPLGMSVLCSIFAVKSNRRIKTTAYSVGGVSTLFLSPC